MKLNIFEDYEVLNEFSQTMKLEHKCGEFFVEILNNYEDIKNRLNKSIHTILENKKKEIVVDYLKYLLPNSDSSSTQNMILFYSIIQIEFKKLNSDFTNNRIEYQSNLEHISNTLRNTNSNIKEEQTWLLQYKEILEETVENFSFENQISQQLFYLDSFLHDLKLIFYFVNEYNTLKNEYYFKAFEIPREIISCVIKEKDKVKLLETKETILCDEIQVRNYIEENFKDEIRILHTYEIEKVTDLFEVYRKLILDKKIYIKQCKNCHRYFLTQKRSDEKYCTNISPQNPNKTCKDIGHNETLKSQIKKPETIEHQHHNAKSYFNQKKRRARINGNKKEEEKISKRYEKYLKDYKIQLEKFKNKKLTEEDFKNWIIKQKEL